MAGDVKAYAEILRGGEMGCITTISGSEGIAVGVFFVLWEAVEGEHLYC